MGDREVKTLRTGIEHVDECGFYWVSAILPVRITANDIDTIVSNFMSSTSRGWCDSVKVDGELLGTDKEKQIGKGGHLTLRDARKNREEILTKEKLIRGIPMYAEKPAHGDVFEVVDHVLQIARQWVDDEEADAIVQYALFADVVYQEA